MKAWVDDHIRVSYTSIENFAWNVIPQKYKKENIILFKNRLKFDVSKYGSVGAELLHSLKNLFC